jgi:hypothetical protein
MTPQSRIGYTTHGNLPASIALKTNCAAAAAQFVSICPLSPP